MREQIDRNNNVIMIRDEDMRQNKVRASTCMGRVMGQKYMRVCECVLDEHG